MNVVERAEEYRSVIETAMAGVDDATALLAPRLVRPWAPGEDVSPGDRRSRGIKLYKVRDGKGHTTQTDWPPELTPDLWEPIEPEHAGTLADPIPAAAGMCYIKGMYYIWDGIIYLCIRQDTENGTTLYCTPDALVGNYFSVVA